MSEIVQRHRPGPKPKGKTSAYPLRLHPRLRAALDDQAVAHGVALCDLMIRYLEAGLMSEPVQIPAEPDVDGAEPR